MQATGLFLVVRNWFILSSSCKRSNIFSRDLLSAERCTRAVTSASPILQMPKEFGSPVSLLPGPLFRIFEITWTPPLYNRTPLGFVPALLLSPPFTFRRFFPLPPPCSPEPAESHQHPCHLGCLVLLWNHLSECSGPWFRKADRGAHVCLCRTHRSQLNSLPPWCPLGIEADNADHFCSFFLWFFCT